MYYLLDSVYTRRYGLLSTNNHYSVKQCKYCKGNFVSYPNPIEFEIHGKPCDFYSFDNINIISDKFLSVLVASNATGYKIKNAECINLNCKPIYYQLVIEGRCGLIKDMNLKTLPYCDDCGRKLPLNNTVHGIRFDENDWDKSDIFAFENFISYPIVTENLKNLIEESKIINLKFVELSTFDVCY